MRSFPELTIRSITTGLPWDALGPENWPRLAEFLQEADRICAQEGIAIRTKRLVLPPVTPEMGMNPTQLRSLTRNVIQKAESCGIRWVCLPLSGDGGWIGEDLRTYAPTLILEEPRLFIHFLFREYKEHPAIEQLEAVGAQILRISEISNNGFDNFRVGTGFNIKPDTPFFPFSWHEGASSFSLAVESLAPLRAAIEAGEKDIFMALAPLCEAIEQTGLTLEKQSGGRLEYRGQDISLAPYPNATDSIALLMEELGLGIFGMAGTSTVTARLTRLLKETLHVGRLRSAGFNGVMFSPLEDAGIARRMCERNLGVDDFLLWATLCGCGIDMVPIPGNTDTRSIAALYADTAALALRHDKPLGVRILPIPNGRVNQLTQFNHDFLVNAPIVEIGGALGADDR